MANESQNSDGIAALADNPVLKAFLAALTVYTYISKYLKRANARREEAAGLAEQFGFGKTFWLVAQMPFVLHTLIAVAALLAAGAELLIIVDQYFLGGVGVQSLPPALQRGVNVFSSRFILFFFVALILYVVFDLQIIEKALCWAVGLIPSKRRTLDWANSKWQLRAGAERRILAASDPELEQAATRIVAELTTTNRANSLAIRPAGLKDENAGNVLYFGHAVEQYFSASGKGSFPWTDFYDALGRVANETGTPFAPKTIRETPKDSNFFAVLQQANAHLADTSKIPNDAGLETAVNNAFATLRNRLKGDAGHLASGFGETDYSCVLRRSKVFLQTDGMRRQFAKLFITWRVKPGATHPPIFAIPFNSNIYIRYLDDGVIRFRGNQFRLKSELVGICFEVIQKRVMDRVFHLISETKDKTRVAWRDKEKADTAARNLDWSWWLYYRADVQAYHDARTYKSNVWKRIGDEISKAGEAPVTTGGDATEEEATPAND